MVRIKDKRNCCGCAACAQRCPRRCITMREDEEGFLYPAVDTTSCINCGLCEAVCPCLHPNSVQDPHSVKAVINPDSSIRLQSSSGGVFSMLAKSVLERGGVVFGARFNENWNVEHHFTKTMAGLAPFRGSKYVQSSIGNSFRDAEAFLKEGRKVLFSGTPCQVAGFRLFLQKEYPNLLTVAIACHSVSSPLVLRSYLDSFGFHNISDINFRDKRISWEQYGLRIIYGKGRVFFQRNDRNPYMQLFLHGLSARPSCFNCPAKEGRSGADLFIGDCWGVSHFLPDYPDSRQGTSFVISLTEQGDLALVVSGIQGHAISIDHVLRHNDGLTRRISIPKNRSAFWAAFLQKEDKRKVILDFARPYLPGFRNKLIRYCKRILAR